MKFFILLSVLYLQLLWINGHPVQEGVGAFAYQDTNGNRYGGTYDLKDGKVVKTSGDLPMFDGNQPGNSDFSGNYGDQPGIDEMLGYGGFPPFFGGGFPFINMFDPEQFFPAYFRNLENCLQDDEVVRNPRAIGFQRVFKSNNDNQRAALSAAQKAFDLTSNQASDDDNLMSRLRPIGFPRPMSSINSAVSSAMAGPGISRQMGMISPSNPNMRNYDVMENFDPNDPSRNGYYTSVSSSSQVSSSNVNGNEITRRISETMVDNNGRVSHYAVHS